MSKKSKNKAEEPSASCQTERSGKLSEYFKGIQISSLEAQEQEMRDYSTQLNLIERMAYLQELIQIAYSKELNDPSANLWDKKIHIDKLL